MMMAVEQTLCCANCRVYLKCNPRPSFQFSRFRVVASVVPRNEDGLERLSTLWFGYATTRTGEGGGV